MDINDIEMEVKRGYLGRGEKSLLEMFEGLGLGKLGTELVDLFEESHIEGFTSGYAFAIDALRKLGDHGGAAFLLAAQEAVLERHKELISTDVESSTATGSQATRGG